jgi:DNA polymerase III subunit beta
MKLTIEREKLVAAMGLHARVASRAPVGPCSGVVKIDAIGPTAITLHSTDSELHLICELHAPMIAGGTVAVDAARLLQVANLTAGESLTLELDGGVLNVSGDSAAYRLPVLGDVADFPDIPFVVGAPSFPMAPGALPLGLQAVLYATAADRGRYALNAVALNVAADATTLVAADGSRMAVIESPLPTPADAAVHGQYLIPRAAADIILRMLRSEPADDGGPAVTVLPNHIRIHRDGWTCTASLAEGVFPNYADVIPKRDQARECHADAETLADAVRRAAIMCTKDAQIVRLTIKDGRALLRAESELGSSAVECSADAPDGSAPDIRMNPDYLVHALATMTSHVVCLSIKDMQTPVVLRTAGAQTAVISPVVPRDDKI